MSKYEFSALRPGEESRECYRCGRSFTPTSRTQKYCPECGRKPIARKDTSEHPAGVYDARTDTDEAEGEAKWTKR